MKDYARKAPRDSPTKQKAPLKAQIIPNYVYVFRFQCWFEVTRLDFCFYFLEIPSLLQPWESGPAFMQPNARPVGDLLLVAPFGKRLGNLHRERPRVWQSLLHVWPGVPYQNLMSPKNQNQKPRDPEAAKYNLKKTALSFRERLYLQEILWFFFSQDFLIALGLGQDLGEFKYYFKKSCSNPLSLDLSCDFFFSQDKCELLDNPQISSDFCGHTSFLWFLKFAGFDTGRMKPRDPILAKWNHGIRYWPNETTGSDTGQMKPHETTRFDSGQMK